MAKRHSAAFGEGTSAKPRAQLLKGFCEEGYILVITGKQKLFSVLFKKFVYSSPYKVYIFVVLILQMRKLRDREVK